MARLQFLVFVVCLPAAAHAQQAPDTATGSAQEQARAHFNLGLNHFKLGEYEAAIADFQAGYRAKPLPLFLFNIGLAARKAGKTNVAIENYQRYIGAETLPNAPELAVARRELKDLLDKPNEPDKTSEPAASDQATDEHGPTGAPPAAPAPTPTVAPPAAPAPVAATVSAPRPALLIRKPWYKDPLGDVLTGSGVAVLGASVGIWASGYRDIQAGQSSLDKHMQDETNGAQGRYIVGLAGIGLGGALIIAGVVRYLVRPSRPTSRAARSAALSMAKGR